MPPNRDFPQTIIDEMNAAVGIKEPVEYFKSLTVAFEILFDLLKVQEKHMQNMSAELNRVKMQSALAIQWEPKVASNMMSKQIDVLRADKETYFQELDAFKKAYTEDRVTQNYHDFCKFWSETLGFHPFLD